MTVATNIAGRGTDIVLGEGVAERGGLHVIATERHDSRRIAVSSSGAAVDRAIPAAPRRWSRWKTSCARCTPGRWGRRVALFSSRIDPEADSPWRERLRGWVLRSAQRNAGRLHARMRRDLMKHDRELERMLAFSGSQE